jgi:hypothetical protein
MLIPGPETNMLPPTVPDEVGVKVTVKVALWPPGRVRGKISPLTVKAGFVVCAAEISAVQVCKFVRTTDRLDLLPTVTWPNDRLEGVADSASWFTPVPPTSTTRFELEALLANPIVPPVHPSAAGMKVTFTSRLCPAGTSTGRVTPEIANAGLLAVTVDNETLVFPEFVSVSIKVSL